MPQFLRYARDRQIPVIALNVQTEITRQVAQGGLESLSESDRAQNPTFATFALPELSPILAPD